MNFFVTVPSSSWLDCPESSFPYLYRYHVQSITCYSRKLIVQLVRGVSYCIARRNAWKRISSCSHQLNVTLSPCAAPSSEWCKRGLSFRMKYIWLLVWKYQTLAESALCPLWWRTPVIHWYSAHCGLVQMSRSRKFTTIPIVLEAVTRKECASIETMRERDGLLLKVVTTPNYDFPDFYCGTCNIFAYTLDVTVF